MKSLTHPTDPAMAIGAPDKECLTAACDPEHLPAISSPELLGENELVQHEMLLPEFALENFRRKLSV